MELIGEKILRLQDSNLKVDGTSTSNETSIFLNRELQEKLDLENDTSIKFLIYKNDLYKLLCFAFSYKGNLYNRTNLVNRSSNWFDKLKLQIDTHFGKEGLIAFEFNVVVQSNNRVYFNSVRQGGRQGLNIRDLFVQNHTKLLFYKNPINDNLHLKFDYSNEEFVESDEELLEQIKSKPNQIYFGAPGTGKSHKIETEILKGVPQEQQERITFHPDYDNASFVGSYMPISETDESDEENIKYKFVPQVFTNIYVKAWQNLDKPYFLVIEEINRGNCAEIFGDIFQLLDRKSNYAITPKTALQKYLIKTLGEKHKGIESGKMILPPNLQLLATMNTSDQSLFPMDSAFKRRWDWKYVPINYDRSEANSSASFTVRLDENRTFSWLDFIEKVNLNYIKNNPNLGEDKCIGNYFIKPNDTEISLDEFINKVIFYLWNDVFQEEDETPFENEKTFSDFFPEEEKGKDLVLLMLKKLEIEPNDSSEISE